MVDRDTVVVGVEPDISRNVFAGTLIGISSPAWAEADACYDAVVRYRVSPALALAIFAEESTYATNPNAVVVKFQTFNPGNTRTSRTGDYPLVNVPGKGNYVKFPAWVEGFADLAARLVDEDFVYVQEGRRTIGQIVERWAPATDQNVPEAYIANVVTRMNRWGAAAPEEETPPMAELVFGRVPHPPFVDRLVLDSQTAAYNNLGPLNPVGVDQHSMVGSLLGTDGWFKRGRGVSTGLTNYGVGGSTDGALDGVIYRWNDPTGKAHPGVSANRSGWANGGSDGLEGDGPLFVRTFGVDGINRNLVSIERSDGGNIATPMSPKQFTSIVALTAYWFDQAKVPWDKFPLNPKYGCVTHLLHKETATKDCPFPAVYDRIDEIQDAVRALLKQYQTSAQPAPTPTPVPPPSPVEPDHSWFGVYQESELKARFSDLIRHNVDGSETVFTFARTGVVTNAWIARAAKEKLKVSDIPVPDDWFVNSSQFTPKIDVIAFGGGTWILERHNEPEGFRWIK